MIIRRFATAAIVAGAGLVLFASAASAFDEPDPPAAMPLVVDNWFILMFPVEETGPIDVFPPDPIAPTFNPGIFSFVPS